MGWWEIDGGDLIGDQPADVVTLELRELAREHERRGLPKPRLGELLAAMETELRGREGELLDGHDSSRVGRLTMRGAETAAGGEPPADSPVRESAASILSKLGNLYRDAHGRLPRLSEVLATVSFVLRAGPGDYLRDLEEGEVGEIVEER